MRGRNSFEIPLGLMVFLVVGCAMSLGGAERDSARQRQVEQHRQEGDRLFRAGAAVAHARTALQMDPGNRRYARAVDAWRHAPRNLASDLFAAFLGLLVLGLVLPGDSSSAPVYDSSAAEGRRWLEHQQRMHEIHMDWLSNMP